jgi:hypothetical protein
VVKLFGQPERARVLAVRARGLVRERYDWRVVGRLACDAVAGAAAAAPGTSAPRRAARSEPNQWGMQAQ